MEHHEERLLHDLDRAHHICLGPRVRKVQSALQAYVALEQCSEQVRSEHCSEHGTIHPPPGIPGIRQDP